MTNQFVYTEEVTIPAKEKGGESTKELRQNSFNVNLVIRTLSLDDGGLLVLLNDLHERWQDIPKINKNGVKSMSREKDTFQSEIRLSKEDKESFFKLTKIK